MGRLKPGRDLLENSIVLFKYALFRRLVANPLFNFADSLQALGASVALGSAGIAAGVVEYDAVTIGSGVTKGGRWGRVSETCRDGTDAPRNLTADGTMVGWNMPTAR